MSGLGMFFDIEGLSKLAQTKEQKLAGARFAIGLDNLKNTYALEGLGGVGNSLKDGALALIKAHPVITSIAALAAIGWGLDHFVFDADEKFDKANKSLSEYSEAVSNLDGVESELADISSRMDELKAQGMLSLVEQDELANLERSNEQLERGKQILETLKQGQLDNLKSDVDEYLKKLPLLLRILNRSILFYQ